MTTEQDELLDLERRRLRATVEADLPTLRSLFHPALEYHHSYGERDDRQSMLDKIESGVYAYDELGISGESAIMVGDTAVVLALQDGVVHVGAELRRLHNSTMSVWVRADGRWSFLAFQPTVLQRTDPVED